MMSLFWVLLSHNNLFIHDINIAYKLNRMTQLYQRIETDQSQPTPLESYSQ